MRVPWRSGALTLLAGLILLGVAVPILGAEESGSDAADGEFDMANHMYFYVRYGGPRHCFVVKQGGGTQFHVHYHFPEAQNEAGQQLFLELRRERDTDPSGKIPDDPITQKTIKESLGSHEFKAPGDGAYSLCVTADKKSLEAAPDKRGLKLALEFDVGKGDKELNHFRDKYNLSELQMALVKMRLDTKGMLREADYMKDEEEVYHKMVRRLNHEVLWWPITQVVILLVTGFYQVRHLQAFFKSKRLV